MEFFNGGWVGRWWGSNVRWSHSSRQEHQC
jgi:hypothetical protein